MSDPWALAHGEVQTHWSWHSTNTYRCGMVPFKLKLIVISCILRINKFVQQ